MKKNSIDNTALREQIELWSVRCKRAKKKQYDLAKESGLSEGHLSIILNFKSNALHQSTIDKIEDTLESWGV